MINRASIETERAKHRSTRRRGCMCDAQSCHSPEFCNQVVCDCGRDLPCLQSEILGLALSADAKDAELTRLREALREQHWRRHDD